MIYLFLLLGLVVPSIDLRALSTIRVASGLERPVYLTSPPGDTSRIVILEQYSGKIKLMKQGEIVREPFLDIGAKIETSGDEQGLLGLAFHPQYGVNGYFYVHYSRRDDGATVISRFKVSADPDKADPASESFVLVFSQPYSNHNGGHLLFGPDGYLWIGTGDGGAGGDPGNRAQNRSEWLGKMLRIDVNRELSYSIPEDNPFWNVANTRPEVWAYGLRNPWRYCFDQDDNLYIADVGQYEWEEINVLTVRESRGANFGWRIMEGKHCYEPPTDCDPSGLILPVWEYDHNAGCSVTGGFVYEGKAIPEISGHYFFADYCANSIWSFKYAAGGIVGLKDRTSELSPKDGSDITGISSFGLDATGELYILDLIDGEVFKIVP